MKIKINKYLIASFFFSIIIISSIIYTNGGILHLESVLRIPNFLDNRSIPEKIFTNVFVNDGGSYQSRELSYFFDILDSYFIKFCIQVGIPHFYSITYFICLLGICLSCFYISIKYFKSSSLTVPLLLGMIFLTSPNAFFNGFFFRSSKPLVSLLLALIMIFVFKIIKTKYFQNKYLIILSIIIFLMTLADRQGYFIALAFLLTFSVLLILSKKKVYLGLIIAALISVILSNTYAYILGPNLIYHFSHVWPSLQYLTFPLDKFVYLWEKLLFKASANFSLDAFDFLFGNVNRLLGFIFIALFSYSIIFLGAINSYHKKLLFTIVLLFFCLDLIMNAIQINELSLLLWPDVRRAVYTMPSTVLILLGLNLTFTNILTKWPRFKKIIIIFLLIILMLNIISLNYHKSVLANGFMKTAYQESPLILKCIKTGNINTSAFKFRYKWNENFCRQMIELSNNKKAK